MPHYFISELLIVLAGLWGVWVSAKHRNPLACLGFLAFAFAAGIGVYRFGFGQIEQLAAFHKLAGQIGGLAGIWGLVLGIAISGKPKPLFMAGGAGLIAVLAAGKFYPGLAVPLFVLGAAVLPIFIWIRAVDQKGLWAVLGGLMLPNVLLIRQSPLLGPELSWHAFHTIIAVWLVILVLLIDRKLQHVAK